MSTLNEDVDRMLHREQVDVARIRQSVASYGIDFVDSEAVPVDLFQAVLQALIEASNELTQLSEMSLPWTDEELEALRLGHDLKVTMENAPEEWKPRLREIYAKARAGSVFSAPGGPTPTLMPGTLEAIADVEELLRRAAITQPAVDEALKGVAGW